MLIVTRIIYSRYSLVSEHNTLREQMTREFSVQKLRIRFNFGVENKKNLLMILQKKSNIIQKIDAVFVLYMEFF